MELAYNVDAGYLLGTFTTWCSLTSCETLFAALQVIYLFPLTGHQIFLRYSHTPSTLCTFRMVYLNSNFQEKTLSCAHHPNYIFCPHTFWLREKNANIFSALIGNMRPFLWLTFYEYVRLTISITTWEMPSLDLSCGARAESWAI